MISDGEGEDAVIRIVDTKEVFLDHARSSVVLPSKSLSVEDYGTFLKLQPSRYVQVAKIILSRCPKAMRAGILKRRAFWTMKKHEGRMFLDKLRSLKSSAIRVKFSVKGHRLTSRLKQQRPKQIMIDSISVPLPTVGDHIGVPVLMKVASTQRVNGKNPLCVQLDPRALDHIAHMAREFFGTVDFNEGFNGSDAPTDDNDDESIDNDDKTEVNTQSGLGNASENADSQAPSDVPGVANNMVSPQKEVNDQSSSRDRPSCSQHPIFTALMRGAKEQ